MAELRSTLRVRADSSVIIAGILFPRWFYEFLGHAARGDFSLVVSPHILDEVRDRVARESAAQQRALQRFLQDCEPEIVSNPARAEIERNLDLVRDPKDVPVALAAIAAGVDYLVSNDKDLTAVDATTARLREFIQPMSVGRFLHEVMGWRSEDLEGIRLRTWQQMDIEAD